ncbi:Transposable element Tc1 transposase [Frankliniella fusca]|uniref:Transposable element Tc1 transposase n=1 Tax=Frankliniella fusca TaxID=407009 RepID=A0AAE1H9Z8_9NEOP|nr:Transposable element Tc1 transposase [Frankliniella fusca]
MQWYAFSGDLGAIPVENCPGNMDRFFYSKSDIAFTVWALCHLSVLFFYIGRHAPLEYPFTSHSNNGRRPQIFTALSSSMPRRIQALIDAQGGSTKY